MSSPTPTTSPLKLAAAQAALQYLRPGEVLGVGSGSTVNVFISLLSPIADQILGAVAASEASAALLRAAGIAVLDPNHVPQLSVYVDGADEVDTHLCLIKGGGAALTREKILAASADMFVCIVDQSKRVDRLGAFPLPVEVIPMAANYVIRQLTAMGGQPKIRNAPATDNGNIIIDVTGLNFDNPLALETTLNQMAGTVCNGVFAQRRADICITAGADGIATERCK
jgi:ribose 5-phosphate isomerase A